MRYFSKLLSPLLALLLSSLLFELLAASFLPLATKRHIYTLTSNFLITNCIFLTHDDEVGWIPQPHSHYRDRTREFSIDIAINSQGYRDDEESLNRPAILLFGDSFAFGCGVNANERADHFLEAQLGEKVLTMGVPGYGTLQEFMLFRRWIKEHPASTPITVFMFYAGNDLSDNMGYGGIRHLPFVTTHNDTYSIVEPTLQGFRDWVSYNRRISCPDICKYSYTAYITCELIRRIKGTSYRHDVAVEQIDYTDKYAVFDFIVRNLGAIAKITDCRTIFLYIPTVIYFEKNDASDDDAEFFRIRSILVSNSMEVIDMRKILMRSDYYPYDGHWRQSGHFKAAEAIRGLIGTVVRLGRRHGLRANVVD